MTLPKILAVFTIVLFSTIAVAVLIKNSKKGGKAEKNVEVVQQAASRPQPIELDFSSETPIAKVEAPHKVEKSQQQTQQTQPSTKRVETAQLTEKKEGPKTAPKKQKGERNSTADSHDEKSLPNANRIDELFNKSGMQLPIVETITYKSRVAWQKGRPAWLSDYASHYKTSRHFIARSLNGKADYFKQDVVDGDRFNVFKENKNISFYLLVDNSRCKMWFYSIDHDLNERILLRRYDVGLGREDNSRKSGYLTPLGKYSLGSKITIYKPTMMGYHNGEKAEMIRIFGTRWIPFEKEISNCTLPAKGFGIHGVPWDNNANASALVENKNSIGKYESDGCIRMATQDMEELFAIIITKPSVIEIVSDFYDAELPAREKKTTK